MRKSAALFFVRKAIDEDIMFSRNLFWFPDKFWFDLARKREDECSVCPLNV